MLGFAVGDSEEAAFWTEFLRSLRQRGLTGVNPSGSIFAAGFIAVLQSVFRIFPSSYRDSLGGAIACRELPQIGRHRIGGGLVIGHHQSLALYDFAVRQKRETRIRRADVGKEAGSGHYDVKPCAARAMMIPHPHRTAP